MLKQSLLLWCIILSVLVNHSSAQDKWAGIGIESNILRGKIFRHTEKFPTQLPKAVTGLEVNAVFQTYGTKDWQQRRHYPVLGFGFMYTDYGIDSIYGKCFSIYPSLQIPLVRYKKFEWTIKAAFGLGFVTKRYERFPTFDTVNTAIGTHFNNFSLFATDIRYRLNQHLDIQAGGTFTHISNAALRNPNLGINVYGAHLGVRYFPTTSQPERIHKELTPLKNRWLVQARLGISGRESFSPDGPMYLNPILSLFASKRYLSRNKLLVGLDYSYHNDVYAFLRVNEIEIGKERQNSWRSAVIVGNEFLFGKVGILLQMGFYLKNHYLAGEFFYQKLGGNLYLLQKEQGLLKEVSTSIILKTHMFEAELVEVGIGVGL